MIHMMLKYLKQTKKNLPVIVSKDMMVTTLKIEGIITKVMTITIELMDIIVTTTTGLRIENIMDTMVDNTMTIVTMGMIRDRHTIGEREEEIMKIVGEEIIDLLGGGMIEIVAGDIIIMIGGKMIEDKTQVHMNLLRQHQHHMINLDKTL